MGEPCGAGTGAVGVTDGLSLLNPMYLSQLRQQSAASVRGLWAADGVMTPGFPC
jgi:hypothetical protein